jgi:hypothetical protein
MPDSDTIPGLLPRDPEWDAARQRLWAMTPNERVAAMRAGELSYALLCEWSARRPDEVPRLQTGSSFAGEFEWLAAFIPEIADADDTPTRTSARHATA